MRRICRSRRALGTYGRASRSAFGLARGFGIWSNGTYATRVRAIRQPECGENSEVSEVEFV